MEVRTGPRASPPGRRAAMLSGVAATALTLGVAELVAGIQVRVFAAAGTPSPVNAVAGAFIDLTPAWLKDLAVAVFGTSDKIALGVGMAIVLALLGAAIGLAAGWRPVVGFGLFAVVALVGGAAVATREGFAATDLVPLLLGAAVGAWALGWLLERVRATGAAPAAREQPETSRRTVLLAGGTLTALGLLGVLAGRVVESAGRAVEEAAHRFGIPVPGRTVSVPEGAGTSVAGHSSYVTPNESFYRIDTAFTVPRVDPQTWRLRVHGMVEQEIEISYADLLAEEHVEAAVTLTCVSNYVGGDLVGNAVWIGWPVRELLARAGVQPGADMVLSRSVDGWTAGTPLEVLTDERDALLAVAMNGEPLPPRHGYPVRLVVPGLYGYVSATKWVTDLKVTRFDADEGYWTPRGWAARGPIKTASRIDVPRQGASVDAGQVVVAGVAWAQTRGISRVEVRVDEGEWAEAELALEPSVDAWRLWSWTWDAAPGQHVLSVRATDGTGQTQTELTAPPAPDGASGWHTIQVVVR